MKASLLRGFALALALGAGVAACSDNSTENAANPPPADEPAQTGSVPAEPATPPAEPAPATPPADSTTTQ
jgi:hypothetical protein